MRDEKIFKDNWSFLEKEAQKIKKISMRDLLLDKSRANDFTQSFSDITIDYSMNRINKDIMKALFNLAESSDLKNEIKKMFSGEKINITESRAVLHTALRNVSNNPIYVDGKDVMTEINQVLEKMKNLSNKIIKGEWKGFTGKKIKNIVNIGIGGSDLGPKMAQLALKKYSNRDLNFRFISNVDETNFYEDVKFFDPEETLFIISSKTFTTEETMANANLAKKWILASMKDIESIKKHFIAVSTNAGEVKKFGIDPDNILEFWDFVGGRYSLTSAIGFSLMISIGYDNFYEMLKGYHEMDMHFLNADFSENLPVILALIGIWNNNFLGYNNIAILPYDEYLSRFPAYLQQLDMESNGKSIDKNGDKVKLETGPILWGEPGTNGQHAFYQLIHQGTKIVPVDFIGFRKDLNGEKDSHDRLISNMFAQAEALCFGKTFEEVLETETKDEFLAKHKTFEGNRPSNKILITELSPKTFGELVALYEHKIFVQGIIWNIFSFDQWGVQLGKVCAKKILKEIQNSLELNHDSSTNNAIKWYKNI